MSRDYLEIGCVPSEEPCAQVGSDDYHKLSKMECRAYIAQLQRLFGPAPDGCRFIIKASPHDFGTYHEVAIEYDEEKKDNVEYAFTLESGADKWDKESKEFLKINGYPFNRIGA